MNWLNRCNWQIGARVLACVMLTTTLAVSCFPTMGQTATAEKDDAKQADGGLLAGPKVDEEAAAKDEPRRPRGENDRRQPSVRPQQWFALLRQLELTADQQTEIRAIVQEFQDSQRAFQEQHGEELQSLQQRIREMNQAGEAANRRPDPELRQKIQRLEAARPRPDEYQQRIWAKLTQTQQSAMRAKIDEIQQRQDQRQERRRDRPGEAMSDAAPAMSDEMMTEGNQPTRPAARPNRGAGGRWAADLDDMARRRVAFLRARQAGDQPGQPPSAEEKTFTFGEDKPKSNEDSMQ